jgi:iron complex outermembrane receptor protein
MRNNQLRLAVRTALAAGALATSVAVPTAIAQEEAAADLDRVQVTGSRIQRTDIEGALPVTVIDREQIERSGFQSVADLLRNTTFNSAGSYRPQSGSSFQGLNLIDLRGLGSSRSLVLVDGRRLTMAPQAGSAQDLNSIPLGAVERIEILSDGASAIYGSDAIGGVVNVITRRDFNGAELTIGHGQVSVPSDGGDRDWGSAVFGSSTADTRIIGGVSWNKREIIFERDFPWVSPGSSIYGNNWFDETFVAKAIPNGCNDANFIATVIGGNDRCQYNFNATNANEASNSLESIFLKADQRINDDWSVFANASVARTNSFGRYAPAPDTNYFYPGYELGPDAFNNPTNPNAWFYDANNPNSVPFDPAFAGTDGVADPRTVYSYHRFAAAGNRDSEVNGENLDFMIGAEGTVGMFEVDFGARRVRNKTYDIGNGYLAAATAWGFVRDFNPGYSPDGLVFDPAQYYYGYDLQSPGANPQDVLSGSVITISRVAEFGIDEVFASAAFDIVEIGGGMIQGFFGAEKRDEKYSDKYDSQSEAGLVGGSAGNSAGGGRDVTAAYFEVLAPVTNTFEVSFAGRYDDYSDFGSNFSPKISFRFQPLDNLMLRASYGEGFRAPPLDILTQQTSFSADSVTDPVTCLALSGDADEPCQINAFYIANPDLGAEESKQYAFGVAYQPLNWLNMSLDYYNIEIDERIRSFTSQNLIDRELAGDPVPPGLGVTRNALGVITRIDAGFGNEGTLETEGIDLNIQTNFNFNEFGRLEQVLQMSQILDYSIDGGRDLTKDPGLPERRISFQNAYTFGDFEFAYNLNLIGKQYRQIVAGEGVGSIGSWTTHDVQVSYFAPWDGQFTIGVQNVTEKLPEFVAFGGRDYNYSLYNGWGRVAYARYTQRF